MGVAGPTTLMSDTSQPAPTHPVSCWESQRSPPQTAHAQQLGSSPGAPRDSQWGQAWPRHLPDLPVPHGLCVSMTSGSQALFLALGIQASAIPRVMLMTAVMIIAHVSGRLVCATLCAKCFTHIISSNPLTHPIRQVL